MQAERGAPQGAAARAPKVTIGLPVYNCEAWLSQTLDAFLAQTFADFELIICDNCSTDGTPEIARRYVEKDARIRYHRNDRNIGAANNYNTAFRQAAGEYFKWSSCNDLCAPTFLERCVEVLDRDPSVVLSFPRTSLIDESGEVTQKYEEYLHLMQDSPLERFEAFLKRIRLCHIEQALMRSSVLRRTGLQGSFWNTDTILIAEVALHGKLYQIEEFLFFRRMAAGASSHYFDTTEFASFNTPGTNALRGQSVKQLRAFASIVPRVPLSFLERLRLIRYVFRMARWSRSDLWRDLVQYLKDGAKRKAPSKPTRP